MKRLNKLAVIGMTMAAVITLSLVNPALAQRDKQGPDPERQEKHLAMLKDRLDLSDGQVNEIKAIMKQSRLEAEKDREKMKGDREEARKVREARRKANDEKIKSILNDKQKKEFDKVKDEIHQRRESRDRDGKHGQREGRRGNR